MAMGGGRQSTLRRRKAICAEEGMATRCSSGEKEVMVCRGRQDAPTRRLAESTKPVVLVIKAIVVAYDIANEVVRQLVQQYC